MNVQFSAAYAYSKCMTNNIGYYGQGGQSGQINWYYQNIYDATHNFVANAVYDLPFGRGRALGKDMNRALDAVVCGWEAGGILSRDASDASNTLSRGGQQNSPEGGYQWLDPASYAQPAPYTFGSCASASYEGRA